MPLRARGVAQRVALREAVRCRPGPMMTMKASVGPGSAERHEGCRTASGTRGNGSGNLGADAADAGGGRLLLLDLEAADLRGAADMRSAAEFHRDVADLV